MNQQIELRPEVLAFARLMEKRLREKDEDKGARWKDAPERHHSVQAMSKAMALESSVRQGFNERIGHAVDLANRCMFIADVAGALVPSPLLGVGEEHY